MRTAVAWVLLGLTGACGRPPPVTTPATASPTPPRVKLTWVVYESDPDAEPPPGVAWPSTRVELLVRGPSGERRLGLPRLPGFVQPALQEPCTGAAAPSGPPPRRLSRLVVPYGGLDWLEVVETAPGRLAVRHDYETDGACDGPCPPTTPQVLHTLEVPSDATYEAHFTVVGSKGGKPQPLQCPPRETPP